MPKYINLNEGYIDTQVSKGYLVILKHESGTYFLAEKISKYVYQIREAISEQYY